MPVQNPAPTRAELEKVFGRPLSDAEYRGMLNIAPAPAVAREGGPAPSSATSGYQKQGVGYAMPGTAVIMQTRMGDGLATQPPSQPVKPLFGLPASPTTDAEKQKAMGPFWYADSAGGHAAGDVATPLEYTQMQQAEKAKPVAPVVTMEPAPGTPVTQELAEGATVVPAPTAAAMILPKKEKK